MKSKKIKIIILKAISRFFISIGILSTSLVFLALTDIPFWAYHRLGTSNCEIKSAPKYIILFGGSGMPSPDGLIRAYYCAQLAKKDTSAKIIIASPNELKALYDSSACYTNELTIRAIEKDRILYDTTGYNTYTQVIGIKNIITKQDDLTVPLVAITSPEHMFRSIRCLQKEGFINVGGIGSFEIPIDEELLVKDGKLTRKEKDKLQLRYNIWSYLNYELVVFREYLAIVYYKLKGWI